jgi:hypothetical protein
VLAYAFVSDHFEQSGDLISGFLPLFAPAIERHAGELFNPAIFCEDLNTLFGIKMNPLAAEALAPRLAVTGLLTVEQSTPSHVQYGV